MHINCAILKNSHIAIIEFKFGVFCRGIIDVLLSR